MQESSHDDDNGGANEAKHVQTFLHIRHEIIELPLNYRGFQHHVSGLDTN